ncbi:DNA primase [Streptomyces goshikiensis]|uniref:DNA primase n=1 Tax=Streptomyces goshikiensis TaxID=1942 RepID=UPI0036D01FCD
MTRTCEHCAGPLAVMARAHARTCSPRCRKALSRAAAKAARSLPVELTTCARWVRRAADKRPLTTTGKAASSTSAATWSTHKEAVESVAGVGTGFVLSDVDDIVCVDIDHCLAPDGTLAPWAADIVSRAGATYIEVSPSGDGLHVFGYADVQRGRRIRRFGGYAVELYSDGRYIAMTGIRYRNAPSSLLNISALIATLV